jgi:hypothetical protein
MDIQLQNQLKRLVEVTALEALSKIYISRDLLPKIAECEKELRKFAFPNELAKEINEETTNHFEKFQGKMKDWDAAGHEVCDDL